MEIVLLCLPLLVKQMARQMEKNIASGVIYRIPSFFLKAVARI